MKRITLKRMTLLNFKGIRSLEADMNRDVCSVMGRNGTGKTTLFDAFTWVLFGKDSRDRKAFDIKTLGADGKAIARLPHEVTAVLDIDGEETTLTRRFTEKWVKRRGSAAEEFTGHEEERLYNDVPCSLKDWNEKIAAICPEETFKTITSPTCFTSLKAETQRALLLRMAGGFTDNEVVAASGQRADFIELLGRLCGKTIEEYKREIGAKKRRVKAELDALPERIDERKRDNAEYDADYQQIEQELKDKEGALANVDAQLTQVTARINEAYKAKQAISDKLAAAREKVMKLTSEVRSKMCEQYYAADNRRSETGYKIASLQGRIKNAMQAVKDIEHEISETSRQKSILLEEWYKILGETLTFTIEDFICPTCNQNLDPDNIEKKREQMTANFNAQKAEKLRINKETGFKYKHEIEQLNAKRESLLHEIDKDEEVVASLNAGLSQLPQAAKPTDADIEAAIQSSPEYKALQGEIQQLERQLAKDVNADADTAELGEAKKMLSDSIAQLKAMLEGRVYKQRNEKRIAELDEQMRNQAEALAQLEGIEFTIADFSKARINAVEDKINRMFSLARWKMYDTQINGGEVETCEAMVNGVPYSGQNNAMRINMGLDIINAISKWQGIAAPIFIDNCESILEPMQTIGQQVRLIVANQEMTIN